MKKEIIFNICAGLLVFAACLYVGIPETTSGVASAKEIVTNEKAKSVILMIGDGMGSSQVTLARWGKSGEDLSTYPTTTLAMDNFPYSGFSTTYAANSFITDSAPAATALMAGVKTNIGVIGQDKSSVNKKQDGVIVDSIAELAEKAGKSSGAVTTTRITHATPAGVYAHINDRDNESVIADQLINSKLDVALGGGTSFFIPQSEKGSKRKDDRDLMNESAKSGWTVVTTADELKTSPDEGKILGLFAGSHMSYDDDRAETTEPALSDMTKKALNVLSKDNDGFFLMVEGGRIDHASHERNATHAIADTLAFDDAISVALKFQEEHPDTLIIVTADHECGGLDLGAINPDSYESGMIPFFGSGIYMNKTTGNLDIAKEATHTAVDVPVFAKGPGADLVTGAPIDNTDIFKLMKSVLSV
jgi:alkaline phosphatase